MIRTFSLTAIGLILLSGCGAEQKAITLDDVVSNSYVIQADMNQSAVREQLKMKPTSIERINNQEIWKYEGNVIDPKTQEGMYHNLIIKFVDGRVKHVGTFSCALPKPPKE